MIAVSDTSPLCYLILIGEIALLPSLFGRVALPPVVRDELLHDDAPQPVRTWAAALPPWIELRETPGIVSEAVSKLHAGEQAAISLAQVLDADILLVDEKAARRVAIGLGIRVTGTLGVLSEASARGLIELPVVIARLRETNFRFSPALLKAVLDGAGSRTGEKDE